MQILYLAGSLPADQMHWVGETQVTGGFLDGRGDFDQGCGYLQMLHTVLSKQKR